VRPLRDDALGEARHEHDLERPASCLMRRADENPSIPARRRLPVEHDEAIAKDVADFLDRHGTDRAHRPERRQRLDDAIGAPECALRQRQRTIEPLAPRRAIRPGGHIVHNRQRELAEVAQVLQVALESPDARGFGLLPFQLMDA